MSKVLQFPVNRSSRRVVVDIRYIDGEAYGFPVNGFARSLLMLACSTAFSMAALYELKAAGVEVHTRAGVVDELRRFYN